MANKSNGVITETMLSESGVGLVVGNVCPVCLVQGAFSTSGDLKDGAPHAIRCPRCLSRFVLTMGMPVTVLITDDWICTLRKSGVLCNPPIETGQSTAATTN
jgi:hypothetical protein